MKLRALFWIACGACSSSDPVVLEDVVPGCVTLDHASSFDGPSDFAPAVRGTLAGWEPEGRWFSTGVPVAASSFRLDRAGAKVLVDGESRTPANLDATELFMRRQGKDADGVTHIEALRISNLAPDGTLRAERATCAGDECEVCTTRLIRATHHANEGEGEGLTRVGELRGSAWGPGATFNVRVAGTIAYLIRRDGLYIIETRDPARPVELSHYQRTSSGYPNDVKLVEAGGRRYALIADTPVDIVDVTDPAAPTLIGQRLESSHTLFTETRDGKTLAYLGNYDGACPVYDVTDPVRPLRLGSYDAGAKLVHDLSVKDGIAYLGAWDRGLVVVDFTTPAAPRLLGSWAATPIGTSHSTWTTKVAGRHIALHGDEGYGARLDIVDVDPASPAFMTPIATWQTRPWISIHNLMAFGAKAYLTHYQDGVRVLDLSDPRAPRQIGYYNTWDPDSATATGAFFEGAIGLDVDLARKLVFVADLPRGLIILADDTP